MVLLSWMAACATLADGAPGLDNPPTARAGPFRLLKAGELGQSRAAPYAMDLQSLHLRDPSVLDIDGDPETLDVEAYFAANAEDAPGSAAPVAIARVSAVDGRSFDRVPVTVLEPTQPWEGGTVGAPCALLDFEDGRWLYYQAAGGIGRAEGPSGGALISRDAPVLASAPWTSGTPKSPAVVRLPGGGYRMFFEAPLGGGRAIGEAESSDGLRWDVFDAPAIVRGGEGAVDQSDVGSPFAVVATSSEGRDILYVYYSGEAADGKRSITMAARFLSDPDGPLEKSGKSLYSPTGRLSPREPSVVRFEEFTLLFTAQNRTKDSDDVVVSVGVSPGDYALAPPEPP